ncbi:DUF1906 domain-containing protein [Actinomadura rayongensis]|uniref:DUF1906 domain-containing protein n=1 Tax=Actinomadura rayongensis TaxID=1429076 RepID=A0A6I4W9V7_9ACTN|nr:DUF1906 domain-containing protein [Actinomadura rayongensis]MXQ66408.1 DUF1906 domain-containing protein [Actinomadura rayongensis]
MSVFGVDYAWGRPGVAALKKAGVDFVCRYFSHDSSGKNLTRAEAEQLCEGGFWLVAVWESTASRALQGRDAGAADAKEAERQAAACGMPDDRPIYFAVDFDASSGQQKKINAYLDGAASVLGTDRVGIYAGYGPVKRAFDAGKIAYGWQTYAWSGGKWDGRAQIQQYSNDHVINGVGLDYDRAVKADYGQWRIGVSPGKDDMPDYVSVGATAAQQLKPGEWTTVAFDKDYSDAEHQHSDEGGPSVLWGPARYALTASVTLDGVPQGTRVQARAIEVKADDTSKFTVAATQDFVSAGEDTALVFAMSADTVDDGYRVRFQVKQFGKDAAKLSSAGAKVLFWRL